MAVGISTYCALIILVLVNQQASHRSRHSWILPQWDAARETLRIPICINLSESGPRCSPCLPQLAAVKIKQQPSLWALEDQYKFLVYGTWQTAILEIYSIFMKLVSVAHPARKKKIVHNSIRQHGWTSKKHLVWVHVSSEMYSDLIILPKLQLQGRDKQFSYLLAININQERLFTTWQPI